MAVDRVPYFVGGGAEHSPEVVRQALYDSTGGAEGVSSVGGMKVLAQPVPNGTVRVIPGGCLMNNRYPGGAGQSYEGRNATETSVAITPTGSGGGRTDLIVARILDPQYEGQPPADPNDFDYFRLVVIQGVPAATTKFKDLNLGYPAVELGKVTLPPSTATVAQAMVTDLRKVAQPRKDPAMRTHAMLSSETENLTVTTGGDGQASGGQTWPTATENAWGAFDIPEWATRAKIVMMWAGVKSNGGNVFGHTWVQVGATANPANIKTQAVKYDTTGSSGTGRIGLVAADEITIPASMRGTSQKFYPRGRRDAASDSGKFLTLDGGSAMVLQIEFLERAD